MTDKQKAAFALRMADRAGEILRRAFGEPASIDAKADNSPVTKADREVEQALRAMIEEAYPQHGIVGEEFGNVRPEADYQWVIDPIDGTRAFIAGYPTFTTLIALAKDGMPVMGIIDQPVLRQRWLGIGGQVTTMNGRPVAAGKRTALSSVVIATTSAPYYFHGEERIVFERLRAACAQTIVGGDGYGYAMLASGRIDVFMDAGLKPYDFCALVPVIEGAGGVITDWDGKPLTLRSDGRVLAAANATLHRQALALAHP